MRSAVGLLGRSRGNDPHSGGAVLHKDSVFGVRACLNTERGCKLAMLLDAVLCCNARFAGAL